MQLRVLKEKGLTPGGWWKMESGRRAARSRYVWSKNNKTRSSFKAKSDCRVQKRRSHIGAETRLVMKWCHLLVDRQNYNPEVEGEDRWGNRVGRWGVLTVHLTAHIFTVWKALSAIILMLDVLRNIKTQRRQCCTRRLKSQMKHSWEEHATVWGQGQAWGAEWHRQAHMMSSSE